jgi:phosphatidylinositol-3-phosphatase
MRRVTAFAGFAALLAMIVGSPSVSAESDHNDLKKFQHVFVIMMENTGYNALIGNPNAPWINAAAHKYGLATRYFGVTHPSQPNYIAATAGIQGNDDDNDETVNVRNIVDQLESKGKSWTAYMQSLSLCATKFDHACGNQLYERKHNPFVSFADVQSSTARMANIVDLSQLNGDLAARNVADYVWISPDQCHDMHGRGGGGASDPCDFSNVQTLISMGDTFLSDTVGKIMSSKAWRGNSAIFIAWDESDFTGGGFNGFGDDSGCCDSIPGQGGGHVVALVISRSDREERTSHVSYNHYSMLRTIQESWKLGCLGATCDKHHVPTMSALLDRHD